MRLLEFIHTIVPALKFLSDNYTTHKGYTEKYRYNSFEEIIDGYKYIFEITRNITSDISSNIYDGVDISRININDDIENRKKTIMVEKINLTKSLVNKDRLLQFPVEKTDMFIDLGEYSVYGDCCYERKTLKPNYCVICDKFFCSLKKNHYKSKKHENNKFKCIGNELKNRLNIDCITNICGYL